MRGVRVLAAVLADAGRIALDVAGIERRLVERRREQQHQPVVAADRAARSTAAIARARARRIAGAGDHAPRTARSSRSGTRRSRPSRAACRRRSSRAGTSRRPRPSRSSAFCSAAACARQRRGARRLAARLGERREGRERRVQEPAEPDALALAAVADPVHAVVPVAGADQRQAVRADGEAAVERARAVLEERARCSSETVGWKKASCSPARSVGPSRNGTVSSSTATSPVDVDVVRGGVGEPDAVVGDARAHALARMAAATSAGRRPRRTAAPRRAADARASSAGPRQRERHAVLQLVAEAVGAARLVEGRARPDAAGERLVEQPAVEQDVHRRGRASSPAPRRARRPSAASTVARARRRDRPRGSARSALRASAAVAASPRKKTISTLSPGAQLERASAARRTDRGRRRPRPESGASRGERGRVARACRCGRGTPRGRRSSASAARRDRRRRRASPKLVFHGLRANIAPVSRVDLGHDERRGRAARTRRAPIRRRR